MSKDKKGREEEAREGGYRGRWGGNGSKEGREERDERRKGGGEG